MPTPDFRDIIAACHDEARESPQTVVKARGLIADPVAAHRAGVVEMQMAWLVALADLRHRRTGTVSTGGTAA